MMKEKLVMAALTTKEAMSCSNMMLELVFGDSFGSVPLYIDSTSALHVTGNRNYSSHAKHIVLRYFFVQGLVGEGNISIHHVQTENQLVIWAPSALASTVNATSSSSLRSLRLKMLTSSSSSSGRPSSSSVKPTSSCWRNTPKYSSYF